MRVKIWAHDLHCGENSFSMAARYLDWVDEMMGEALWWEIWFIVNKPKRNVELKSVIGEVHCKREKCCAYEPLTAGRKLAENWLWPNFCAAHFQILQEPCCSKSHSLFLLITKINEEWNFLLERFSMDSLTDGWICSLLLSKTYYKWGKWRLLRHRFFRFAQNLSFEILAFFD